MRLDVLCELDLLRSEVEIAETQPYDMDIDTVNEDISLMQNTIKKLGDMKDISYCLPTKLYYEMQANILETDKPERVIQFYESRIKDIAGFEFCEEFIVNDDLNNYEYLEAIYNALDNESEEEERNYQEHYLRAFAKLRRLCVQGIISEEQRKKIKRLLFDLHSEWADMLWWIWEDLQAVKEGNNKRPRTQQHTRSRNGELDDCLIAGLEKLYQHQDKIKYVDKEQDKYIWVQRGRKKTDPINVTGLYHLVDSVYGGGYPVWSDIENYFGVVNLKTKRPGSAKWVADMDRILSQN